MTIRISIPGLAAAAATVLLSGCALEARTDSDPRASVAACHNYAFAEASESRPEGATAFGNPLNGKALA